MSKPTRVLHCFGKMDRGGAETYIMNIYRNINRDKIQFDFVVHTEDKCSYDDEILSMGGKIYRVPRYNGINLLKYIKAWEKLFRSNDKKWTIIHGHMFTTASIYLKIATKYKLTTIVHSHGTSTGKGITSKIKNCVQYPVRYIADYLLACSNSAGEWLYGNKVNNNEKYIIINNAINAKEFSFNYKKRDLKRKELGVDNKFIIGHVGSFMAVKNHTMLIDIFHEIRKENKDAVLLIVGDGPLRNKMEKKVRDLNLYDSVIFTGVRSDVSELFQIIDVLVFPSLYEGLPLTLIEAQASGVKCVVSDNITEEVKITENIEFLSLDNSLDYWSKQVLKYEEGYERKNTYIEICNSGYDIKENVKWLEKFYLNIK